MIADTLLFNNFSSNFAISLVELRGGFGVQYIDMNLLKGWALNQRYLVHLRQLGIILGVATAGLGTGTVVASLTSQSFQVPIQPSPRSSAALVLSQASPSPSPEIISLAEPSPTPAESPKVNSQPVLPTQKVAQPAVASRSFAWGVSVLPFPLREKNEQFLPEQFRLAKELGLQTVRIDYSINNQTANQQAIDLAHQYGLQLVFIIPFGPKDIFTDPDLANNAYRYVADIVTKHKGQVPVWQLATEVASVALVDGAHHGVDRVDYPEKKYQAVATWLKAASKAVKDTDPAARRLMNDQWIHVGFFDRFIAEGGDFDIIGWNWFSDMGTDFNRPVIDRKTGQRYDLIKKLKSYKKDIWLTEVNRRMGSNDGNEKAQADYIQTMAEAAYREPAIKAFLIYNLAEDQQAPASERGYGLVQIDKEKQWIGGLKEAYNRYKNLIAAKK